MSIRLAFNSESFNSINIHLQERQLGPCDSTDVESKYAIDSEETQDVRLEAACIDSSRYSSLLNDWVAELSKCTSNVPRFRQYDSSEDLFLSASDDESSAGRDQTSDCDRDSSQTSQEIESSPLLLKRRASTATKPSPFSPAVIDLTDCS